MNGTNEQRIGNKRLRRTESKQLNATEMNSLPEKEIKLIRTMFRFRCTYAPSIYMELVEQ